MTDKICHLCGTHYNDDPLLSEQPSHTPEQCLSLLRFRIQELEVKLYDYIANLKRAEVEYKKAEGK